MSPTIRGCFASSASHPRQTIRMHNTQQALTRTLSSLNLLGKRNGHARTNECTNQQTNERTSSRANTRACTSKQERKHSRTHTRTHARTFTRAHAHTRTLARLHARSYHTSAHAYRPTIQAHTCIDKTPNTHTRTTHNLAPSSFSLSPFLSPSSPPGICLMPSKGPPITYKGLWREGVIR